MIKKTAAYCLFLFLACVVAQAQVFEPVTNQPVQSLSAYLQVSEDKNNSITIEQLLSDQHPLAFHSFARIEKPDMRSTWWAKLDILPSFSSEDFYIGLPNQERPGISQGNDNADVWIVRDNNIMANYRTGNLVPVSDRPVARPINHNLFPVSLKEKQPITIYWRISRSVNFEPLQFSFALQHGSVIHSVSSPGDKLAWFYTGVMLIIFFFGLVFYL
ncbi:MAG: 7TM-DISM domain-containing protein, partial [Bacteroidota bacterium]